MTTDEVIEQIRTLSQAADIEKVSRALDERRTELEADVAAANRIEELRFWQNKSSRSQGGFQLRSQ
jgi:hypothetical protein